MVYEVKVNQTDCDQNMLQDNSVQAEVKSKSKPDNCVIWIFCCIFELWVMWSKHSSRDNSSQAVKAIEKSNGLWSQSKSKVDNFVFEFSVLSRNYERCDQNTLQGTILFRLRAIEKSKENQNQTICNLVFPLILFPKYERCNQNTLQFKGQFFSQAEGNWERCCYQCLSRNCFRQ